MRDTRRSTWPLLIDRTGRGLTNEGTMVLERARRVLREVEAISSVSRLNQLAEKFVTARSLEEMGLG